MNNSTHSLAKQLSIVSVLVSSLLFQGCGSSGSSSTPTPTPTPTPAPAPAPTPAPSTADLDALLSQNRDSNVPGMMLMINGTNVDYTGTIGVSSLETFEPLNILDQFPMASSGKLFIAILANKLAEAGQLNLDDNISQHLPTELVTQITNGDQITLRQLLLHTAGVWDYVNEETSYLENVIETPETIRSDIDFISYSYNQPAYSAPGEAYNYSNAGYSLAGLVMDAVTGEHHSAALREHVLTPIAADNTYYRAVEKERGNIISGYHDFDDGNIDVKPYVENFVMASSPLNSTLGEMQRLFKATITDEQFISPETRNALYGDDALTHLQGPDYVGMSIIKSTMHNESLYATSGLIYGYHNVHYYFEDLDLSISAAANCSNPVCVTSVGNLMRDVAEALVD